VATFTHGSNAAVFLVDSGATERNISSAVTSVSDDFTADTAEVSSLGDTAKQYIAGLKDATFSVEGNRDATIEGYVYGVLGSSKAWAIFPEGSASGKVKYSGTAICTSFNEASDVGDANKWSAEFQVTGAVTRATV
jgi:hypothetical protein